MYTIEFSQAAEKQFYKLDKKVGDRILAVLERIRQRPFAFDIKRLVDSPYYRLKAGDYRVILDIQQNKLMILVIEIGHRKNIYE